MRKFRIHICILLNWSGTLYLTLYSCKQIISSFPLALDCFITFVPHLPDVSSVSSLYFYSPSSISILSSLVLSFFSLFYASSSLPHPFIVSFVKFYPLSCRNNTLGEKLCASHHFICCINRHIESLESTSDDWNRQVREWIRLPCLFSPSLWILLHRLLANVATLLQRLPLSLVLGCRAPLLSREAVTSSSSQL